MGPLSAPTTAFDQTFTTVRMIDTPFTKRSIVVWLLLLTVAIGSIGCARHAQTPFMAESSAVDDDELAASVDDDDTALADDVLADIDELDEVLAEESEGTVLQGNMSKAPAGSSEYSSVSPVYRMVNVAMSQIGTRYRRGGIAPETGFDCSGFTTWVFTSLGVSLPRTSQSQFLEGAKVARSELKTGDLVFFKRKKRRISHVGIYLDDGKFIHSSSTGDTVKISDLDSPVWRKQWAGARRVF